MRARLYESVEDLHVALRKTGREEVLRSHVPTWRVMSKLVMAMKGNHEWQETAIARDYQGTKLGRDDGETFVTELMPLPCPNIRAWPYPLLFPTKADYIAKVRPSRIQWLRAEVSGSKPRFVICYGKGNWFQYKEIFSDVRFSSEIDGKIRAGQRGHSTILLLPFLSYDQVTTALITQIAHRFGQEYGGG